MIIFNQEFYSRAYNKNIFRYAKSQKCYLSYTLTQKVNLKQNKDINQKRYSQNMEPIHGIGEFIE